jgi:hypothetical protein
MLGSTGKGWNIPSYRAGAVEKKKFDATSVRKSGGGTILHNSSHHVCNDDFKNDPYPQQQKVYSHAHPPGDVDETSKRPYFRPASAKVRGS